MPTVQTLRESPTRTAPKRQVIARTRRLTAPHLLEGRGFTRLSWMVDVLMLLLAVGAAVAGASAADVPVNFGAELVIFPPLTILLLYLRGMYRPRLRVLLLDGISSVVSAISVAAMVSVALVEFTDPLAQPTALAARAWVFALLYVSGGRILLTLSQRRARERGVLARPALIVGAGQVGTRVARRLSEAPEYGLRPVGFLDPDPMPAGEGDDRGPAVLGTPDDLTEVVALTGASHVILAFTNEPDSSLLPLIRRCEELGVQVSLVPRLFDSINDRVALEHLGGMPLLALRSVDPKSWQFAIKHGFDRLATFVGLLFLAPLLALVAIGVKLSSPGPILYRQPRLGSDGREFEMLKFRTMTGDAGDEGEADAGWASEILGGEEVAPRPVKDRRTPFGRVVRKLSLDELPQLINVLRGDMSIVGPRPERVTYAQAFGEHVDRYSDRHRVRSGITGWAQVHGLRGQTSLSDRVEWDNYYIENWSLWLDFKIMLMTVVAVARGGDVD
jgi:exopolysaccharide biosynthesis polyprenyl glycosylphosphotransferase